MARRSDHTREELRSMILAAARDIVERQGYQSLTVRAVTREIGYTPGTLYQIFASVTDLKLSVNAETVAELRTRIVDQTREIADPKARLRQMSHAYVDYAFAHPDLWRLAFERLSGFEGGHPSIITRETEGVVYCARRVLGAIAPGIAEERLVAVAAAFWSAVHGVCHLALSRKLDLATARPVDAVLDLLIDTFLAGLAKT
jgi:AcrR family transcriptional regulator